MAHSRVPPTQDYNQYDQWCREQAELAHPWGTGQLHDVLQNISYYEALISMWPVIKMQPKDSTLQQQQQ